MSTAAPRAAKMLKVPRQAFLPKIGGADASVTQESIKMMDCEKIHRKSLDSWTE